jgi:hypothetical protein
MSSLTVGEFPASWVVEQLTTTRVVENVVDSDWTSQLNLRTFFYVHSVTWTQQFTLVCIIMCLSYYVGDLNMNVTNYEHNAHCPMAAMKITTIIADNPLFIHT